MSARWKVETVEEANVICLKSCFSKYLTASNMPMLLGMAGKRDWVLWDIDILENKKKRPPPVTVQQAFTPLPLPPLPPELLMSDDRVCSLGKAGGRLIYYMVGDDVGSVDERAKEELFYFKGTGLEERKQKLEEETGLNDISVCSKNPSKGDDASTS
ncbi:hypothetical protein Bca52824_068377 [Brassica carinata]|uniref:DUF569 domain-containing protein n=1 Tax=Brassica carinata TaxID=52824 RepID=A0A8X7Q1P3_BRACI|nr:hypothetical protein Bca52824_068377 [Brassica carinata]